MATSYYSTGTVSLTNGSAVVTGNGTGWQLALISGGNVIVQAPGNVLPIASVDSDTQITAELQWTGATGTYSYTIQRDTAYLKSLDKNSESLSYLISEMRNGTLFKYDASGDLSGRALYDLKPKGFGYLVTIGVSEPDFYVKGSDTDGDWEGPFAYGVGPVGPQGPVGFLDFKGDYNPATAYVANDGVRYNGSSWVALQATTGNAPPNLPTTENAYWSLLAIKGQDGAGTGDMQAATYDPQNKYADAFDSANHDYDNTASGLSSETVQGAIDELAQSGLGAGVNDALFALELADLKGGRMGMVGGVADPFDDETGVDTAASANEVYDATNDRYSPTSVGLLPSYSNPGGTGNRTSTITASTTMTPAGGSAGSASVLIDGSFADGYYWAAQTVAGKEIKFDFGSPYIITEARGYTNNTNADGTWQWQGSNDGSAWTNIGPQATLNGAMTKMYTELSANTVAYRYYRMLGISGSCSGQNYQREFEFKIGTALTVTYNPMTLLSVAVAATSQPSRARAALQVIETDAITINTDLTAEVSRDGGTTWSLGALSLAADFGGVKMYEANEIDVSAQPAGSSMKWRVKTLNNKNVAVSGVVLQWR